MSDRLSETATLFEFFSLLAAGKHDGNARDEFAPVLKKMTILSKKDNTAQSLGKDCSKHIIPLSTTGWPPAIAPNTAEICMDQKAVHSTTTPPSIINNTQSKNTEMSTKTSIDEEMPIGYFPVTGDDGASAPKDKKSKYTLKKLVQELRNKMELTEMVQELLQTSQKKYRPLSEGVKQDSRAACQQGRKRSKMAEWCEREDRVWKRQRVERRAV